MSTPGTQVVGGLSAAGELLAALVRPTGSGGITGGGGGPGGPEPDEGLEVGWIGFGTPGGGAGGFGESMHVTTFWSWIVTP
jgi:hypothetical protein